MILRADEAFWSRWTGLVAACAMRCGDTVGQSYEASQSLARQTSPMADPLAMSLRALAVRRCQAGEEVALRSDSWSMLRHVGSNRPALITAASKSPDDELGRPQALRDHGGDLHRVLHRGGTRASRQDPGVAALRYRDGDAVGGGDHCQCSHPTTQAQWPRPFGLRGAATAATAGPSAT